MNLNFWVVLGSVGMLLLLCLPGFLLRKLRLLQTEAVSVLTTVMIYVNQPALTFHSFQGATCNRQMLVDMAVTAGLAFAVLMLGFFVFALIKKRLPIGESRQGVFAFASIAPNCGFIGIPVLTALFPDKPEMIVYAGVFIAVFNIFSWTFGIYLLTGDKGAISLKKAALNPAVITVLVAIPFFVLDIRVARLSAQLNDIIASLASMTTPVSMTILGIRLAEVRARDLLLRPSLYALSGIKLLVLPLVMLALSLLVSSVTLRAALVLIAAMPTAALTVAFSDRFGADSHYAACGMLTCSILSVITIPLIALLL